MRGWEKEDYGSLLWPEMALAAQVLKGYSGGAEVEGGGEGGPCAHPTTYLKPCWFQAWP